MKANSAKTNFVVKDCIRGLTEVSIKVIGLKTKSMERVDLHMLTGENIVVNLFRIKNKGMGY